MTLRLFPMLLCVSCLLGSALADAGDIRKPFTDYGIAGNANLLVNAPAGDFLAYRAAVVADRIRGELAEELCGQSLPEGAEFAAVSIIIRRGEQRSHTLLRKPNETSGTKIFIIVDHDDESLWMPLLKRELEKCVRNYPRTVRE